MTTKILNTRTATTAEWNTLADRIGDPERRAAFLRGETPCFDDAAGTRRVLPPPGVERAPAPAGGVTFTRLNAPSPTPAKPTTVEELAARLARVGATEDAEAEAAHAADTAAVWRAQAPAPEPAPEPTSPEDRATLAALAARLRKA